MPIHVPRRGRTASLAVALIICLTMVTGAAGVARAARTVPAGLPASAPVHVAFLGDSYTFGVGATQPADGYAYLVATKHTGDDATMINYAAGHPNNRGYEHIAKLLEADLDALGVH